MKKIKMYLKKFLIGCVVLVILIALLSLWERHRIRSRTPIFSIVTENIEKYNRVAHLVYQIFEECGKCKGHIHFQPVDGNSIVWHSDFGHEEREFQTELTNEEILAFETVFDTYRMRRVSHTLYMIYVSEDFLVFHSEGWGQESLIYSVNGERPDFVNDPSGNESYTSTTIQRIAENWFYARVNFG